MVWLSRSRSNQQPRRPLRPIWPKAISQPSRTNPSASLLSPSTPPHAASLFLPRSPPRALDLLLPLDHPVPPHPLPRSHPPRRPLLASRRLSPLSSWRRYTERGPLPRPCQTPDPERRPLKGPAFAPPSSMAVADRARSSRRCTSSRLCCLLAASHPRRRPGFPCTSILTPDLRPPPPRCPLAPCRPIWPRRPGSSMVLPCCFLQRPSPPCRFRRPHAPASSMALLPSMAALPLSPYRRCPAQHLQEMARASIPCSSASGPSVLRPSPLHDAKYMHRALNRQGRPPNRDSPSTRSTETAKFVSTAFEIAK